MMTKGDHEAAIHYYRVSLKLDPDSSNAARMIELLLGHSKLDSTARYLGVEIDDAVEMSEQMDV